jgi:hypothetical protein
MYFTERFQARLPVASACGHSSQPRFVSYDTIRESSYSYGMQSRHNLERLVNLYFGTIHPADFRPCELRRLVAGTDPFHLGGSPRRGYPDDLIQVSVIGFGNQVPSRIEGV